MRTSEAINEIAAALAHAQGAITNAEKDRVNPHLGNKYMTLTSVWDAIRKPLSDNGLSIVQVTEADDDGAVLLLTRLMHASGQYIEATYPVIGMENRGVNAAQAAGSALTYARRYSLTSLIGVVADEDDDAGAATGNRQQAKPQPKPAPVTGKPAPAQPAPSAGPAWTPDPNGFDDLPSAERNGGNGKATATPHSERPFKDQGSAVQWACRFPHYRKLDKNGVSQPDVPHAVGAIKSICDKLGCSERDVDTWADAFMDHVAAKAAADLQADLDKQAAAQS